MTDSLTNLQLPRVFVIGSSTTLLFGPHLQRMLWATYTYSRKGLGSPGMSTALADLDTAQGASAGNSDRVLAYLNSPEGATEVQTDIVLLHVGLHDIRRDPITRKPEVPLDRFTANIEQCVRWFASRSQTLIWLTPGPIDEATHNSRSKGHLRFESDLATYRAAAESIMATHAVPILDLAGFTAGLGPCDQLTRDHIHYTDEVVCLQAAFIAGYLHSRAHLVNLPLDRPEGFVSEDSLVAGRRPPHAPRGAGPRRPTKPRTAPQPELPDHSTSPHPTNILTLYVMPPLEKRGALQDLTLHPHLHPPYGLTCFL